MTAIEQSMINASSWRKFLDIATKQQVEQELSYLWQMLRAERDFNKKSIAELEKWQKANTWHPIETAPLDTIVIVWPPTFTGSTSTAAWCKDLLYRQPKPYWKRFDSNSITNSRNKPPTHWMPVIPGPDLPKEKRNDP